jgi:hypothetical protein
MRQPGQAPIKPAVKADILHQLDIRVGAIEAVAEAPGSDKLVELRANFGGMLFDIGHADGFRPVLAVPESSAPDGVRAG